MSQRITDSIIVKGNVSDIFNIWSNFENFPNFMENIRSVTRTGERTSHWVMEGPLGTKVEWDAETTRLEPDQRIAWNSKDNSNVKTSGQVTFRSLTPGETEVTVMLHYDPPAGLAGDVIAALFENPERRMKEDLRRFKEYVEGTAERIHNSPNR